MCRSAPALSHDIIRTRYLKQNISERDIRELINDSCFCVLKYKNNQLCYCHKYYVDSFVKHILNTQLAEIFSMDRATVSNCSKNGPHEPKIVEEKIVDKILEQETACRAMRENDILCFIKNRFGFDLTRGWFNCFFMRHIEELQKCHSTPQEYKRI